MKSKLANWFIAKVGKWLMQEKPANRAYLCDFDRVSYELRPADIILVEGRHRVSDIIRHVTFSPWTHAALYIGRLHDIEDPTLREIVKKNCPYPPSRQLVIESLLGKGTIIASLDKYRDDHLRICRPMGLSRVDTQKVIAFAFGRLGSTYSLRNIFDLARFFFPWSFLPRRWRSSLFQHNALQPTEDICSSMIAQAFESVNFPILPLILKEQDKIELIHRNPRLFTPSDFDFSPYFAIIKYPIFPVSQAAYRDLPWRTGVVGDEFGDVMIEIPTPPPESNKPLNQDVAK